MNANDLLLWRKRHKLTQAEAGKMIGRDRVTIGLYERGELAIPTRGRAGLRGNRYT